MAAALFKADADGDDPIQAAAVRIIDWAGAPPTGDAADWVVAGCTPAIGDLFTSARPFAPSPSPSSEAAPTDDGARPGGVFDVSPAALAMLAVTGEC